MTEEALTIQHQAAVKFSPNHQWAMIEDPNAKDIFKLASLFPSAAIIPKARIYLYSGIDRNESGPSNSMDNALLVLYELNLIEDLENGKSIRLHPLVQQFVLDMLSSKDQERSLRNKAVTNLGNCYDDPLRLEKEVDERGIDAVIEDILIGISWCDKDTPGLVKLEEMLRVVDQERHHFSNDFNKKIGPPPNLLQQLYYRSSILGLKRLGEKFYDRNRHKNLPTFRFLFANKMEDMARICTLRGHTAPIKEVSLSEDGRRGISRSSDNIIILWDIESCRTIRSFEVEKSGKAVVALGTNGRDILYVAREKELILEDIEKGDVKKTLQVPSGVIKEVFLSTDGQHVVIISKCNDESKYQPDSAILWDLKNDEILHTIQKFNTKIYSVSGDGRLALCDGYPLDLWDLKSGKIILNFDKMSDYVDLIRLSPDGRFAVGGDEYGRLRLWDCNSGERAHTFRGHEEEITALTFSNDGRLLISGSRDMTSIVWEVESHRRVHIFKGHTDSVSAVCFSADGRRVLTGSKDGCLILWDMKNRKYSQKSKGHKDKIVGVELDESGQWALSGSEENKLILWDVMKGKQIRNFTGSFFPRSPKSLNGLGLSADNRRAMSCSCGWDGKSNIILWDLERQNKALAWFSLDYYPWGDKNAPVRALIPQPMRATSVALDAAGWIIMSGCDNGIIILSDGKKSGKRLCELFGHKGAVRAVALNSSKGMALSGGDDNKVILWDIKNHRKISEFIGHSAPITTVCLAPDGNSAISGSKDQTLILWDLKSGVKQKTFTGHLAPVTSVRFFNNGQFVISCSLDSSVIVWDTNLGKNLAQLWVRYPLLNLSIARNNVILGSDSGVVEIFEILI